MESETIILSPLTPTLGPNFAEASTNHLIEATSAKSAVGAPLDRGSLLALIQQQVEYYFSDDNLPKDVFLLKQIEKDKTKEGFVSLKVIAGFPKMKRLTHDLGAIREAVELSEVVLLSSDGLSVKRKVPLILPEDTTEKRTLYVTRLPKDCDRESLMIVFSEFGTVIRLDLPMDKKTGEHKGMAFVEFQREEELRKALDDFTNSNKYKMVAKPFKSRNNKDKSGNDNTEGEDESEEEADDSPASKEKRQSGGTKKRNSKEKQLERPETPEKRASKEINGRNSKEPKEKRNSKENKSQLDGTQERRNSKDSKNSPENCEKRNSKDLKSQQQEKEKRNSKDSKRNSKEQKKEQRTSKDSLNTGREIPESAYDGQNSYNQARARTGSRGGRNSKEPPQSSDWEDSSSHRPKLHLKGQGEERPLFVPVRNPIGPSPDGLRGFTAGRGKMLVR